MNKGAAGILSALIAWFALLSGAPGHCFYQYDFGDNWWHEIKLLNVSQMNEKSRRTLIGGEFSFSHEDCGGTHDYERCVAAAIGKWTAAFEAEIDRVDLIR